MVETLSSKMEFLQVRAANFLNYRQLFRALGSTKRMLGAQLLLSLILPIPCHYSFYCQCLEKNRNSISNHRRWKETFSTTCSSSTFKCFAIIILKGRLWSSIAFNMIAITQDRLPKLGKIITGCSWKFPWHKSELIYKGNPCLRQKALNHRTRKVYYQ